MLARVYMERREMEVYELRHATARPSQAIPSEMERELQFIYNNTRRKRTNGFKNGHSLTLAYVKHLYVVQRARCAVSGIPFNLEPTIPGKPHSRAFAPSIDRIRSDKGYQQGNVRLVCRIANIAMNIWGDDALLKLALGVTSLWERGCALSVQLSQPETEATENVE